MMTFPMACRALVLSAVFAGWAGAQSFLTAISQFPELSNFTTLMYDNPGLAGAILTSNATSLTKITVLVPDNSAFDKLEAKLGAPIGSLTVQQLEPILQYLVLVGELTTNNFTVQNGTTVPTFLNGPTYNNRSAGAALGSTGASNDPHNGQVVFIDALGGDSTPPKRFRVRQLAPPVATVQGGLGHQINMTAVNGYWDGGVFQIVDKFLDLPLNCTETIRRWNLTGFDGGLARTGLGLPLDVTKNVTCLGPSDQAFLQAGSPNVTYNITDLAQLMLFHVIDEPLYTNFLADGQEYTTFSNQTVRISIRDGAIFANDAKLIHTNVMTNNGLMHVLDRVMSPLEEVASSSSTSSAATPLATPSSSSMPTQTAIASSTTTAATSTGEASSSSAATGTGTAPATTTGTATTTATATAAAILATSPHRFAGLIELVAFLLSFLLL